jgi:hypothetical protein
VSEYLVGSPAFKAGVRGDPSQAGSIPVHLRVSDASQTDRDAEVVARNGADDLRVRAARIRERSVELIDELGADHPLVIRALAKAESLEREADKPGEIHLH